MKADEPVFDFLALLNEVLISVIEWLREFLLIILCDLGAC